MGVTSLWNLGSFLSLMDVPHALLWAFLHIHLLRCKLCRFRLMWQVVLSTLQADSPDSTPMLINAP